MEPDHQQVEANDECRSAATSSESFLVLDRFPISCLGWDKVASNPAMGVGFIYPSTRCDATECFASNGVSTRIESAVIVKIPRFLVIRRLARRRARSVRWAKQKASELGGHFSV